MLKGDTVAISAHMSLELLSTELIEPNLGFSCSWQCISLWLILSLLLGTEVLSVGFQCLTGSDIFSFTHAFINSDIH